MRVFELLQNRLFKANIGVIPEQVDESQKEIP